MNEAATILCLFVGELLGDTTFFLFSFHRNKEGENDREEKKKQYYITKYSVLIALLACIPGEMTKLVFLLLPILFKELNKIWSDLSGIIGIFDRFACIAVFMFSYNKIRKGWKEKFNSNSVGPWGESDPMGIYVQTGLPGKYELSEKWVYIRDCVKYLMIANLLFLAAVNLHPKVRDLSGSIAIHDSLELIPIVACTILMEFYNYLSFDDRIFFRKRRKAAEKSGFDLVRLMTEYEGKKIKELSPSFDIKRHEHRIEDAMYEYIEKLAENTEPDIKLFMNYLEKRRWSEQHYYHTGSLETAVRLIKGENLFCASPFYKDIDICIFFMAYLTVMKGKKVLVLAEDRDNLNELVQWLKQGIEGVQKLDDYYEVSILEETKDEVDLGVMSFQDVYRPEDFRWLKPFFHEVGFVVIIEASGMLAGGQEAISNLAEQIGGSLEECTWLLCDNNAESMLDLFSHLLNKRFTYVSATPLPAEGSLVGYWDVEKEKIQPWKPVEHYLGAEFQAAEVAWCYKIPVTLYGEEMVPIYDLKWIVGQYYRQFHNLTKRKPHQYVMDDGIYMEVSGNGCGMGEECFLIVEDANFNLYEAARQYVTRASKRAVVHILSPNYLLRDFMKDKKETLYVDPKYIAQFVPEYVNTRRNVAVHLIRRMLLHPVTEARIKAELEKSEAWERPFQGMEDVKELIRLIVPCADFSGGDFLVSYQSYYDKAEGINIKERCYQLNSGNIKRQFLRYFQKACYIAEDGKKRHIGKLILAGHLDQKYLKGQLVVFDGLYYEIMKRQITDYEYILHVRRASEQISGRRYYRQDRCYTLDHVKEYSYIPVNCQVKNLTVRSFTADIEVKTNGYYACKGWNEIADATYIVLGEEDVQARKYISKQFLKIRIDIDDIEEAKILAIQMACLFQESFCTFYPQQYHLLSVALDRGQYLTEGEGRLKGVLADIKLKEQEEEREKKESKREKSGEQEKKGEQEKDGGQDGGQEKKEEQEKDGKQEQEQDGEQEKKEEQEHQTEEVCFYIMEDSMEDMGLLRSIERNFERMQVLLSQYMEWSRENSDGYLLFGRR